MAEIHKKLTDTQFRLLLDAQIKHDEAVRILRDLTTNLDKIRALILDAHDIDESHAVSINPKSQELIIHEPSEGKNSQRILLHNDC